MLQKGTKEEREREEGRKKEIRGMTSVLAVFFSVSSRIRV